MPKLEPWFINNYFNNLNYIDFLLRIIVAAICGGLIGYEREKRLKNAGLRTHIIVSIAACSMMIVSKYGFMDVVALKDVRLQADVSRIAHGVVSAIGFLGAGVIFVRRENTVGVTTAAGLWATVGIGITVGSGMYTLGIFTTLLVLFIQELLHRFHTKSHNQNSGVIKCNITKHNVSIEDIRKYLESIDVTIRDLSMKKNQFNETVVRANILFSQDVEMIEIMETLEKAEIIDEAEIYPIF